MKSQKLFLWRNAHYPTKARREFRAITGLSIGGHGGLYPGIRHKDISGEAGITSGGVDFRPFPKSWEIIKALGDSVCCKKTGIRML